MAIRQCEQCAELMQEGFHVEHTESGEMWYYCNSCTSESEMNESFKELKEQYMYEYVDWQPHEMDDEDFFLLMNELLSAHQPHEIAKILDILDREDPAHYGTEGVIAQFTQYLQHQQKVHDQLKGLQ